MRTAGEEARWTAQSKEFDVQIQRLTGDCALASAFVSYLGPFNKEFRELLLHRDFYGDCMKLNVPVTPHMQITKFLVDDSEVGEWNLQGLPTDELSIQNGIMVTRASRYPVLVDPQVGRGKGRLPDRGNINPCVPVRKSALCVLRPVLCLHTNGADCCCLTFVGPRPRVDQEPRGGEPAQDHAAERQAVPQPPGGVPGVRAAAAD